MAVCHGINTIKPCIFLIQIQDVLLPICLNRDLKGTEKKVAPSSFPTTSSMDRIVSIDTSGGSWGIHPHAYLEIVGLGAGSLSTSYRVYWRFGHFDLHHLLGTWGGEMHIEKQGIQTHRYAVEEERRRWESRRGQTSAMFMRGDAQGTSTLMHL